MITPKLRRVPAALPTSALILSALLMCVPARASAQAVYGSISGIVSDTSGATVPGASVTITGDELTGATAVSAQLDLADISRHVAPQRGRRDGRGCRIEN